MKYIILLALILSIISVGFSYKLMMVQEQLQVVQDNLYKAQNALSQAQISLGSTVTSTASSDTLETFRTNVNASLASLQNDKVSTTTAYTWTALQKFFANASTTGLSANFAQFGGTATTTFNSSGVATFSATTSVSTAIGIASTTPFTRLGIGSANATSTISGGYFCQYFRDEAGRGMWIKLATSGTVVFATSTSPCNI